jgi:hypothetical protein
MVLLTNGPDDAGMENAVMVVPIGSFTPSISQRVCETAIAHSHACPVVISMHNAEDYSWNALRMLADALHAADTPYSICVAYALPRTRALLDVFGIENLRHVRDAFARSERRIMIA